MAAPIIVEEEAWKCLKHPSNRQRNGVCPVCLKERLAILCPDCAASKTAWFRSLFKYSSKSARKSEPELKEEKQSGVNFVSARCSGAGDGGIVDFAALMRSRSVSVQVTSGCGVGDLTKGKGWHFRSSVKAFRQPKVVQERSPLFKS
nr:uncharacterized protein LOC109177147 [Ipomoea batatas]